MAERNEALETQEHYIIAIGASAGGLEAIHDFFDNMPPSENLSFVIIQHLSPDYKSLLVELVSKHTRMQVKEAEHNMAVEPNCVYVIPNNKLLSIKEGVLQLESKAAEKAPNTAIDTFLRSLALDQGPKAIALILSGTGTDGSKGIIEIHKADGFILVQDPLSAKFDGMPNSAIATGVVDLILAPEMMPEEIFNLINEKPVSFAADGRPDDAALPEVLRLVERSCGHDFTNYKAPTILRRITRRMSLLGYKDFKGYLSLLRKSTDECGFLGKEFLIGVTKFFRDRQAFTLLHDEVLMPLVNSKTDTDSIKVWVTACSTGEEAYSFAILIDEVLQRTGKNLEVKIFASDMDAEAIEIAAKGVYSAASLAELSPERMQNYFVKEGINYTIIARIRKQIVFARHNILKDPPFIKNDVVSCRNMLIYMNGVLQRKVVNTLQFSLNTEGYLFLGPSESPLETDDGFREINGKWKLYQKMTSVSRHRAELPAGNLSVQRRHPASEKSRSAGNVVTAQLADDFKTILTEKYGFAGVYIDKDFNIKEGIGNYNKYLSLPEKLASLNLLKMVGKKFSLTLNNAVRKAMKENRQVQLDNVKLTEEGESNHTLLVRPGSQHGYTLVVIGEGLPGQEPAGNNAHSLSEVSVAYVTELEEELRETKSNLQMAVESLETSNEELQSSNEELLSANEELQSSNEELQSLNEELHTLNTEHQLRIKELVQLNDDLNNYFRSTEIAQVFVDGNYRIRKFNPSAVKTVNLIEGDIGRPIGHISTNLANGKNFVDDIRRAVESGVPVEKEIQLLNGTTHLMKILPYLRQDKQVDGAVITFVDISYQKELNTIIRGVFNATFSAVMALKAVRNGRGELMDFEWTAANHASDKLLQKTANEYIGASLKAIFPQLLKKGILERLQTVMETGEAYNSEIQLELRGEQAWYDLIATPLLDGVVLSLTDISDKKKAEEKLKRNYYELIKSKEAFRSLNAGLERKITERTFELSQSEERFRLISNATSDAIWDRDLIADSLWWSDSFYKEFGYEKTEKTNAVSFWRDGIHPDDRERAITVINEAINRGTNWNLRYRFKKANGTFLPVEDKGVVLKDDNGIPYRLLGSLTDKTAEAIQQQNEELKLSNAELEDVVAQRTEDLRKQKAMLEIANEELSKSNEEFEFVTDFMPQMVWVTKPDGDHVFYNKGWYEYTGLSYEQTRGEGWNSVLHPHDQPRAWKVWRHSLQTGAHYEIEYRIRRHDGEYRWFLGRAQPMCNEAGEIMKWFGTCTDIHDQKMMTDLLEGKVKDRTAALEQTNRELEKSNADLMQFASIASHDLKEPLRKISMFGNLLSTRYKTELTTGASDYVSKMVAATSRMSNLVEDLLSFTRLSADSAFQQTDLRFLLADVLSDLELVIQEKHAIVDTTSLPNAEVVPGQMRQVFQNIIANSLKFTKPGVAPRISITCLRVSDLTFVDAHSPDGPFFRINIQDNGIGFDNAYAEKMFTIFQRLHPKEKYDGTGIGLAIVKKIIENHHGIIRATGNVGEGACFTFVLPLEQADKTGKKLRREGTSH